MKLTGLYIENFGCLHQYELEFRDGLTVLREPNGFGKTTLAEFIRAMFYGFPRAAKTLDKNKRKKYIPWNGGKCGGNLTFEWEGAGYRIERTFGATPRGDSFQLIDLTTNKKSGRFSEDIGVELFGLDADSFERSTYMPQLHDLGSLSTDSIRAKLGDLVEDANDVGNFEKAVAALKNKRSTFVPYRGNGGSVAEARTQVSCFQEELDRAEGKRKDLTAAQTQIAGLEAELEQTGAELAAVRAQITRASQSAADAAVRQQYEEMLTQHRKISEGAQMQRFAQGVPAAEDFDTARRDCERYVALNAELRSGGLSQAEQARLAELERFFAAGVPGGEELEALSGQVQKRTQLCLTSVHQKLSPEEQERLDALERYFQRGVPAERDIDEARTGLDRAALLRQEADKLAEVPAGVPKTRPGHLGVVLLLAAGILALAAGAALIAADGMVPGILLLGAGAVLLTAGGILGRKRSADRARYDAAGEKRVRMEQCLREADALEMEVRAFVGRYSKMQSMPDGILELRNNRAAYLALKVRSDGLRESREQTERELAAYTQSLDRALTPYFGANCDFEQAVPALWLRRSQLRDLEAKKDAAEVREKELYEQAEALRRKLCAFLEPHCRESCPEQFHSLLSEFQRDCDEYTRLRTRQKELAEQISAFRQEHQTVLEAGAAEDTPDLEALKEQEKQLAGRITDLTRTMLEQKQAASQLRSEIDRIPELQDGLELWQAKQRAGQADADTLDQTLDYLQKARESLSGNYLGTIQRSFASYLGRMMGGEKALVTSDLEVQLERQGQARELGYFSAGQTDMVMLCMRFALVDALFSDVKPFVILDDPFVNLDDGRTVQALALLDELARERQIIYLVCNSSRV